MSTAASRPAGASHDDDVEIQRIRRQRAEDPDEAQRILSDNCMPHRLLVTTGSPLDMELASARFGQITAGLLSYGTAVHLVTADTTHFHVNLTLGGRAVSRSGRGAAVVTTSGQAVVFRVGEPAQVTWSSDCRQLCLMVPRSKVEAQLGQLLGRSLTEPLNFERTLRTEVGPVWQPALQAIAEELDHPSGLLTRPMIARHLEGLVIDGLLLTQPHNQQGALQREPPTGGARAIAHAVEMLEEFPAEPWTVVGLAQRVHLSVRALQYGFRRRYDTTPMAYLREIRLRRAHAALLAAAPTMTTVRAVAHECGFVHMGRFAAAYRQHYGERPSTTLERSPGEPPNV